MLTIIRAGVATTLQDAGRTGWRQYGITPGGAMDQPAMKTANLLVGNTPEEAVLEITLGQFSAQFEQDTWIALTGASCHARLDDQPLWTGWRTRVRRGQRLTLGMPRHGMRSYLAVSGGYQGEKVMGSLSTNTQAGFGGFDGRVLKEGDRLAFGDARREFKDRAGVRQLLWGNRIRALSGPEYHEFSAESQELLWRAAWRLNPQSNRMGYRFEGPRLNREHERDLLSHGLLPGVVQVPPGGQPIVLMSDAQTTGGYPRIACVIEADLYHLAQLRLGEPVHFVPCTLNEALTAKAQQQRYLESIAMGLAHEN